MDADEARPGSVTLSHADELATEAVSPDAVLAMGRAVVVLACLLSGFDSGATVARESCSARLRLSLALSLISNSLAISAAVLLILASPNVPQSRCRVLLWLTEAGEDVRRDAL